MAYLFCFLLIAAGLLGASALIVAKKPDAQRIIDSLVPFQALIGAGALVLAIINLLRIGPRVVFDLIKLYPVYGVVVLAAILSGIVLGFMFAVPLMGRLGAGQQKAAELSQKLAPYQMMIGLVAVGSGLALLLYSLGIIPATFMNSM